MRIVTMLAAVAALGLTMGAAQADVVIKKGHHDLDRHRRVTVIKHNEPGYRAHAEGKKVIIKNGGHRDRD